MENFLIAFNLGCSKEKRLLCSLQLYKVQLIAGTANLKTRHARSQNSDRVEFEAVDK